MQSCFPCHQWVCIVLRVVEVDCLLVKSLLPSAFGRPAANRWRHLTQHIDLVPNSLVTGGRSLIRVLQTSRKHSQLFEKKQQDARIRNPETAACFTKTIRNMSFKDERFDSRARPLLRLLKGILTCVEFLAELLSVGDEEDPCRPGIIVEGEHLFALWYTTNY